MATPTPPVAERVPQVLESCGDIREDPYFWLADRDDPKVIQYLEEENRYLSDFLAPTRELQRRLYDEMVGRIAESDTSAPVYDGPWEYYYKERQGENYRVHYRKPRRGNGEKMFLDENALAKGQRFFRLHSLKVSPDHRIAAYSTDTTGNERCQIRFLDLDSGRPLPDALDETSGNFAWSGDSSSIYYTRLNDAQRPHQLWHHRLGEGKRPEDRLILEESDDAFYVHVSATCSRRFIAVDISSINATEVHLIDSANQGAGARMVFARQREVEYSVEDHGDDLYVLTNEDAVNFRIMKTSVTAPDKSTWQTVVPHSAEATLNGMAAFRDFMAISERSDGLPKIRIIEFESNRSYLVDPPADVQELHVGANLEFDTDVCRLNGNALNTPLSQYDFDIRSGQCAHVKTKPVRGGYDSNEYATERHEAVSRDGTKVPLYLICRKGLDRSKPAALLLNGYGSYGHSYPLYFSSNRLSLLNRGVIYAIAHLRGGGEIGKRWHHDGKLRKKKNTFDDFAACAEYLIDSGITCPELLAISGGSAGGLVVGSFLNSHRGRCRAAVAHVPFVDILTTILDDSLPLSVTERDEWGDPNEEKTYRYIKSYSPYDNAAAGDYPAMYVTAGLNDTRVGYWEPAKWVAKLRCLKRDANPLLLKTEMHAGHSGKSGRYDALKDVAEEYAFILSQLMPD